MPEGPEWDWGAARERCLHEARRIVGTDAADDVVQLAFVRAWRYQTTCQDASRPLPWLLAITRREAFRWLSRARSARETPLDAVAEAADIRAQAEHDAVLTQAALREVLARLSPDDVRLAELRFTEDLSYSDIADRLAWPEGTVATRLHRLRKRLRTQFDEALR